MFNIPPLRNRVLMFNRIYMLILQLFWHGVVHLSYLFLLFCCVFYRKTSFCYCQVFRGMAKLLLLKYAVLFFFLVSVVVSESRKIKELCEVELWHWAVCTWTYESSLAWCGSLQRISLVFFLLCLHRSNYYFWLTFKKNSDLDEWVHQSCYSLFQCHLILLLFSVHFSLRLDWFLWSFGNALKGTS